jgi:hypothetical protein
MEIYKNYETADHLINQTVRSRELLNQRGRAEGLLRRAAASGTLGGLATAIAASLAGKCEDGSYAAPLNATSHVIWGDKAARQDDVSLKYTLTGFLLNYASAIFWALFYEKLLGRPASRSQKMSSGHRASGTAPAKAKSLAKPILGAAAVTAGAYIIDYCLIPERFTPGFEKRLSGKSLAAVFATLAVGLAARDLMDAAKAKRK